MMKLKNYLSLAMLTILLLSSACASIGSSQMTLQEWQRSHLPTTLG
jgi:hypothetical protein